MTSILPSPQDSLPDFSLPHAMLSRRAADPTFRSLPSRKMRLRKLAAAVKAYRADIAEALRRDLGKGRAEAEVSEVHSVRLEIRLALRNLDRWARTRRVATPSTLLMASSQVRREPKGAVLILAPWNYPANLALTPLVSAIAAGNTVALKPSEKAPRTAEVLVKLLRETFAPDEVAVFTGGPEVARGLLELPWDHVFFTGSTRVGREVMRAASKHLSPVTLELGGKSPAIVHASADLKLAAERVAWAKFVNAGQTCVAPDFALVHESVALRFVSELKKATVVSYGEAARLQGNRDYGRLVDEGSAERLQALVEDAVALGAKVEIGGSAAPSERFMAPTILTNVDGHMKVMEEEIFGPVLPILTYREEVEIASLVTELGSPLALYVFAEDNGFVERTLRDTRSGGVVVNGALSHILNPHLPFGGVGPSGMGSYHGEWGFKTFSHERAVLRQGRLSALKAMTPPYGRPVPRLTAWLLRLIS
ncbi:aldehyde dehydrogenase family protein [Deinococcus yavapaiensis]|uniref:Aldehyde dehydrogenase n=1 Tax=Deinococcus yavapaiensis KR-236 TaxID=694435 RepID=A0A318SD58_9DEIO|nr:aldehyde dehydrogenase family protein [Deinococcus yavapaiensis]PYE54409.1 aldehyde dehydrogenase (NAD+) [Deinococcus yavapaiensis KR-236]